MSNLLNGFKNATSNKTGKGDKKSYGLTEVLGIMAMIASSDSKLTANQIAELSGRSVHSIRYKFFEGVVTINGVTQQRSVGKYTTYEELYAAHGVTKMPTDIEQDVSDRVEQYKTDLLSKINGTDEADEEGSNEDAVA